MKKETQIGVATAALRKVLKEIGIVQFRHEASGSLACRMTRHMRGHWRSQYMPEATINLARRRILSECQSCGRQFSKRKG